MGYNEASRWHTYDTLNRLTDSRLKDSQNWSSPAEKTTTYEYDDVGNRVSHSYRDAAAIGYAHDDANRMTTMAGVSPAYDDAGNMTLGYSADRGSSYTYAYDHLNRVISADQAGIGGFGDDEGEFTYDALGRRIEVINDTLVTTTRYYYDGVNEVVETDEEGTNQRWYVHGVSYVDERLMMMDPDADGEPSYPRPYYYAIDRMYNVRGPVENGRSANRRGHVSRTVSGAL